ncbi:MAG: hypothetical protein REH83_03535 [Rickettsiella sp.]|nr:hypothetical protein [Rickettsiella sp.]
MGILDTVVQTVKKKLDNKTEKNFIVGSRQVFRYIHISDLALKIYTVPFSSLTENKEQNEIFFDSFFAGEIKKAESFLNYLSIFDLSKQIVKFLSSKKEFLLNLLIDFVHADFILYKYDGKLVCYIKLKQVTVNDKNNIKCNPFDLTLDLEWKNDKFLLYSSDNLDIRIKKIIQARAAKKEISFLNFSDKCIAEYDKLNEYENFISIYERIKKFYINNKEIAVDDISLGKFFCWLESIKNLSGEMIIVLPFESLTLKYHMAEIIYGFLKYKKNNSVKYNLIESILGILLENFNFYEYYYKKNNFLVHLNTFIHSNQYDDLCELKKAYKELPSNTLSAKAVELFQKSTCGLFFLYKESYIELINELLKILKNKTIEEKYLTDFSSMELNLNNLSVKDLDDFVLFIYQYSLLLEEKNANKTPNILNKLNNPLFLKKKSSIIEMQYYDKFGLDIKERLKYFLLVPEDLRTLDELLDANPNIKPAYLEIKNSLSVNKINPINENLFKLINKLIVKNIVSLPVLQTIYQWIKVKDDSDSVGEDIKVEKLTILSVKSAVESGDSSVSLGSLIDEENNNIVLEPEIISQLNTYEATVTNQDLAGSETIRNTIVTKGKFPSKFFQISDNLKTNLSLEEIDNLREKIIEELNKDFNYLNEKPSFNLKTLLQDRYHTIPERIKKLLEKFCDGINNELNAFNIIHPTLGEFTQQMNVMKQEQINIVQKLQINIRGFVARADVHIYNQKKLEIEYKSSLKFSFLFNNSMFARIRRGYLCKDNSFLNKLTNNIMFHNCDEEYLGAVYKKQLLKISWLDLLKKYRILRWPWESKNSFAMRFIEYIRLNFYLKQIQLIEDLQNEVKKQVEFIDPSKTSISTAADIKKLASKLKILSEAILQNENKNQSISVLQNEGKSFTNLSKTNSSLCGKIKDLIEKNERLNNMERKIQKNALMSVEQLVKNLKNKSKVVTSFPSLICNESNNFFPHALQTSAEIKDCDKVMFNSTKGSLSFKFSI